MTSICCGFAVQHVSTVDKILTDSMLRGLSVVAELLVKTINTQNKNKHLKNKNHLMNFESQPTCYAPPLSLPPIHILSSSCTCSGTESSTITLAQVLLA